VIEKRELIMMNWLFRALNNRRRQAASARRAAESRGGKLRFESLESRRMLSAVTWVGGASGLWDKAANWSTGAVPGASSNISIGSGATVTIQSGDAESIASLSTAAGSTLAMSGGSLSATSASLAGNCTVAYGATLSGTVTFLATANWSGSMSGTMQIASSGTLNVSSSTHATLSGVLDNYGAANWTGGQIWMIPGATINNYGSWTDNPAVGAYGEVIYECLQNIHPCAFNSEPGATFTQAAGATNFSELHINSPVIFNNLGTVVVSQGTLNLLSGVAQIPGSTPTQVGTVVIPGTPGTLTSGNWEILAGGTLSTMPGGPAVTTNDGNVTLSGGGSSFAAIAGLTTNNGNFSVLAGATFTTAGGLTNSGSLSIGGAVDVKGSYTQAAEGTLVEQIGGTGAGQFGQLTATGTASLAGALDVDLTGGFQPGVGDNFAFLSAASVVGQFGSIAEITPGSTIPFSVTYTADTATLEVT
jgi:hypothetical protein